ncbi:MAG: hypothetical protein ACR2KK_06260 [Acidimicrobiales bacterium]
MPAWPLSVVAGDGRRLSLAQVLGPGGERVQALLDALAEANPVVDVDGLIRTTPAGRVDLPVTRVALAEGAEASGRVDRQWLAVLDRRRSVSRLALEATGRREEMEAALHVALLVATERLDPDDDTDVDAHIASGARLWLVAGAVVSALSDIEPDPFEAWARLIGAGWWPVGPSGGRLVLSACR